MTYELYTIGRKLGIAGTTKMIEEFGKETNRGWEEVDYNGGDCQEISIKFDSKWHDLAENGYQAFERYATKRIKG